MSTDKTRTALMISEKLKMLEASGHWSGSRVSKVSGISLRVVRCLGLVIYQALDYGLDDTEEHKLSPALEGLIQRMIDNDEEEDQDVSVNRGSDDVDGDEGIENDVEDDLRSPDNKKDDYRMSIDEVIQFCSAHLENPLDGALHYKAVCRALFAEATELLSFLERIATEKEQLQVDGDADSAEHAHLEQLQRGDWAHLWIQMMHELRQGVKLRKVASVNVRSSLEFELTPYEILMEDIRSHRYTLNKVMVDGDIPPRTKQDAHNVMLEFIRSRPPLHPVNDRKLPSPPPSVCNPRELLLDAIRSEPKLRPTPNSLVDITSDETNTPQRKIIKPNFSLCLSDEDEELSDSADDEFGDKNKVSPSPLSPLVPLSPPTLDDQLTWPQTVVHDLVTTVTRESPQRRHSITVCETPGGAASHRKKVYHYVTAAELLSDPGYHGYEMTYLAPDVPLSHTSGYTASGIMVSRKSRQGRRKIETDLHDTSDFCSDVGSTLLNSGLRFNPSVIYVFGMFHLLNGRYDRDSKARHKVAACDLRDRAEHRHGITVSESPASSEHAVDPHSHPATKLTSFLMSCKSNNLQSSLDCLSLTVDEVMHIRNVLTKAEVETLLVDPKLHDLVDKGKVCFTCRKTKFSLFGSWATKCKFCQRYVCSKCVSKVRIPTEHFEHIPVYALSPGSPSNGNDGSELTGSVPTSPSCSRSSFSPLGHSTPHRTGSNPDLLDAINMSPEMTASPFTRLKELALQGAQMALSNGASDEESPSRSKRNLQRSHTIAKPEKVLRGQEMDICTDCKMMIMEIIRASRSCLMAAPSKLNRERVFGSCPPPRKPNRDFHLNLKPVYKPSHKK
ncbi:hypothetical protein LSH36_303g01013 [Paralvinella palmiformis]|uniref:KIND domain-containing protein n=1 Tax=Paralvinella palmiformis TaxID=53620 RepID=A0AAD9JHT9_9ANNE|nr:hypothetical protein LSH36_303g01013 [Paralvinella palmiformis]